MPATALKNEREPAPIDRSLFERVRDSGLAAVKIAGWVAILKQSNMTNEELQTIVSSIEKCRVESQTLVGEAEYSDDLRLVEIARKVEGLWTMLSEKVAARVQHFTVGPLRPL